MKDATNTSGRLLGYVQLQVGERVYAIPVESIHVEQDHASSRPGGFFTDAAGKFGILVDDSDASNNVQAQIVEASAEAVRHISRRFLN
jgi:hypothetical protein